MFENLGYERGEFDNGIKYCTKGMRQGFCEIDKKTITFLKDEKEVFVWANYDEGNINMQELQAINEKCKESGWL